MSIPCGVKYNIYKNHELEIGKTHLGLHKKRIWGKWKNQKHAYTQHESGVQNAKNEGGRNHKEYTDKLLNVVNKVRLLGNYFSDERNLQNFVVSVPERHE